MQKNKKTTRKPLFGNNRSHAMNATRRRFNLNFIKVKVKNDDGSIINKKITVREYRTLKKHNKI